MAHAVTTKTAKGRNGVGDSVTVYFDHTDPAERKALEAARLLATKHGRRKQAIIALLEAVYNHYEQTGELLSAGEITTALSGQVALIRPTSPGFTTIASTDMPPEEQRKQRKHANSREPHVVITSGGKADARTVADNFLKSMGGAFFD
jgi:hypothetical protein